MSLGASPRVDAAGESTAAGADGLSGLSRLAAGAPAGALTAAHVSELLGLAPRLRTALDEELTAWLRGFPTPADHAAAELVAAGGKRIRPVLCFLAATSVGGDAERALPVAVAVELLHTGSLLHDDVVDDGETRRGQPTARSRYGNPLAVLAGDFCLFAAIDALTHTGDHALLEAAMDVARRLVEGELMQLERRGRPAATSVADYWAIAERKTGVLFGFATGGGARRGGASPEHEAVLTDYGRALGTAFQVVDDVLDFEAEEAVLGKQLGADLMRGVASLPLLYAAESRPRLMDALGGLAAALATGAPEEEWRPACGELLGAVRATDALPRALGEARRLTQRALACLDTLPDSGARASLQLLGGLLLQRTS